MIPSELGVLHPGFTRGYPSRTMQALPQSPAVYMGVFLGTPEPTGVQKQSRLRASLMNSQAS